LFCFATATRISCDAIVIELLHIDSTYCGMLVTPQLAEVFVSARMLYKFANGFDGRWAAVFEYSPQSTLEAGAWKIGCFENVGSGIVPFLGNNGPGRDRCRFGNRDRAHQAHLAHLQCNRPPNAARVPYYGNRAKPPDLFDCSCAL
jgi:hypothetical protein